MANVDAKIVEEISKILSAKLGNFVAESLVRVNCKKIGIEKDSLDKTNLPSFVNGLKVSLVLFLKENEINQVIKEIEELIVD